jgi:hypothetical protein
MYAIEKEKFDKAIPQLEELRRVLGDRQKLEEGLRRLSEENRRIQAQLQQECSRPLVKDVILRIGRRIVHFGRSHRATIAPHGSVRDRLAKELMATQRRLRGKAG